MSLIGHRVNDAMIGDVDVDVFVSNHDGVKKEVGGGIIEVSFVGADNLSGLFGL